MGNNFEILEYEWTGAKLFTVFSSRHYLVPYLGFFFFYIDSASFFFIILFQMFFFPGRCGMMGLRFLFRSSPEKEFTNLVRNPCTGRSDKAFSPVVSRNNVTNENQTIEKEITWLRPQSNHRSCSCWSYWH